MGTDHAPQWTNNGNAFLNAIGVNTITGSFGNPVNFADPTSVLLSDVTPTELWGGGQTVGSAPIGIQPNGTEMFIHFGNQDNNILPYISASFDLQGVEPPPPTSVPEPSTLALMGLVLLGMASRRKAKSY